MSLTLTTHQGELTEMDILQNLVRMMELDREAKKEPLLPWAQSMTKAQAMYWENHDKFLSLARPGMTLIPLESLGMMKEELESEVFQLGLRDWLMSRFD